MITKTTINGKNYYVTTVGSYREACALERKVYSIPNTIRHSFNKRFDGVIGKWKVNWKAIK